jgi:hypothetical protein
VQTAPPRAVRVRHVRSAETGAWRDELIPALALSPAKQAAVMNAMYRRCACAAACTWCCYCSHIALHASQSASLGLLLLVAALAQRGLCLCREHVCQSR